MQPAVSMAVNSLRSLEEICAPDGHILNEGNSGIHHGPPENEAILRRLAGERLSHLQALARPATKRSPLTGAGTQRPALRPCNPTLPVPALTLP
jgi:hypothetical protein